jgi:hypothetical protein
MPLDLVFSGALWYKFWCSEPAEVKKCLAVAAARAGGQSGATARLGGIFKEKVVAGQMARR